MSAARTFRRLWACLLGIAVLLFAQPASAQLAFSFRTGDSTTFAQPVSYDSNNCPAKGPLTAYVGGVVSNSSGATVTNITATLSGLGSGFALAGSQPATMAIGSLPAGSSIGVYWLVSYPCVTATTNPVMTITSSAATITRTFAVTATSSISAAAGGNVTSATLGPGAVVGQTVYFDALYDFGGADVGDKFVLQPNGSSIFRADCFRLVGATITSSNVVPAVVGTTNQFYFVETVKQPGNNYYIGVRYFFQYLCANTSTVARPYAIQQSGNTNLKYTGNYDGTGSIPINYPGATNPFTITKTASISKVPAGGGQSVTYTVTVSNPSTHDSVISSFSDTLPAGASFVGLAPGSDVTAANSSSLPSAGATGTLTFQGIMGQSYAIAAGGLVKLVYTVTMPSTAGSYVNAALGNFGSASTPTATATVTVAPVMPISITKVSAVFADGFNPTNPKAIPGATMQYAIAINNASGFTIDPGTISITDATPASLRFVVADINGSGSGPVRYIDGATTTGLSYVFTGLASTTDGVDFSADNGATWTYIPVAGPDGTDALVTNIRLKPTGPMADATSGTFYIRYVIK